MIQWVMFHDFIINDGDSIVDRILLQSHIVFRCKGTFLLSLFQIADELIYRNRLGEEESLEIPTTHILKQLDLLFVFSAFAKRDKPKFEYHIHVVLQKDFTHLALLASPKEGFVDLDDLEIHRTINGLEIGIPCSEIIHEEGKAECLKLSYLIHRLRILVGKGGFGDFDGDVIARDLVFLHKGSKTLRQISLQKLPS